MKEKVKTIDILRESSNLNTVWGDDYINPNKQTYNKYMSNNDILST